jgi:glycosyl transferase family 25
MLNEFFGKIYCVNLDRRADRWEQTVTALPGHQLIRVPAVDSVELPFQSSRLMPAEIACTMSHLKTLRLFMETGEDRCLVIEDDILPMSEHWLAVFGNAASHLDEDWDLFYLGANHVTPPNRIIESLGKPTRAYSTCAYGVSRQGAEYILKHVSPDRSQVDVQYATINRGKYFCTVPNVFTQRPDFSDVQGGWVNYTTAFDPTKKV